MPSPLSFFSFLIVLRSPERCVNVLLLPFFCSAADENNQAVSIFAKVDPVARAEVEPRFEAAFETVELLEPSLPAKAVRALPDEAEAR